MNREGGVKDEIMFPWGDGVRGSGNWRKFFPSEVMVE
jgi:hypothetical protein